MPALFGRARRHAAPILLPCASIQRHGLARLQHPRSMHQITLPRQRKRLWRVHLDCVYDLLLPACLRHLRHHGSQRSVCPVSAVRRGVWQVVWIDGRGLSACRHSGEEVYACGFFFWGEVKGFVKICALCTDADCLFLLLLCSCTARQVRSHWRSCISRRYAQYKHCKK